MCGLDSRPSVLIWLVAVANVLRTPRASAAKSAHTVVRLGFLGPDLHPTAPSVLTVASQVVRLTSNPPVRLCREPQGRRIARNQDRAVDFGSH